MIDVFPGKKLPVLFATFLVPSFLYWTSGLHKEGLLFTGISLIMYCMYFGLKEKKFGIGRIIMHPAGLTDPFKPPEFLIASIIPAMIAWLLATASRNMAWRSLQVFIFSLASCFLPSDILIRGLIFPRPLSISSRNS